MKIEMMLIFIILILTIPLFSDDGDSVLVIFTNSGSAGGVTGTYIQNQSDSSQTANFRISGNGLIGGNVGIGTITPQNKLHINGGSGSADIRLTNSNTGSTISDGLLLSMATAGDNGYLWNYENGYLQFGTNNNTQMTILSNGNVGIGTTNPLNKLHIKGSSSNIMILESTSNNDLLAFYRDGVRKAVIGVQDSTNGNRFYVYHDPSSSFPFCVSSTGNVGIGTTSPRGTLDIRNTRGPGDWGNIRIGDYGEIGETYFNNWFYLGINAVLTTSSASLNKFTPTWNPGYGIVMSGDIVVGSLDFYGISWGGSGAEKTYTADFTHVMTLLYNGNVGIGTTSPSTKLQVNGNIKANDIELSNTGSRIKSMFDIQAGSVCRGKSTLTRTLSLQMSSGETGTSKCNTWVNGSCIGVTRFHSMGIDEIYWLGCSTSYSSSKDYACCAIN